MGAWGARLYENDTALDIKDRFADLRKGKTVQQITNELIEEYTCELDDVFCAPVFWFALADTQWNLGRLLPEVKEQALAVFQQYTRNQSMFTLWNIKADQLEPMFSEANYNPKMLAVENNIFGKYGRGNGNACISKGIDALEWSNQPWELEKNKAETTQKVFPEVGR